MTPLIFCIFILFLQWFISQQVPQFEDVKFEAASILSELFCQQVKAFHFFFYITCDVTLLYCEVEVSLATYASVLEAVSVLVHADYDVH